MNFDHQHDDTGKVIRTIKACICITIIIAVSLIYEILS